jgi:hypothetical protein
VAARYALCRRSACAQNPFVASALALAAPAHARAGAPPQEKPGKGGAPRGHAGFTAKLVVLTLLEVDQTGKSASDVGTVTLNLADCASADPTAQTVRLLPLTALPGVAGARAPPPAQRLASGCAQR